MMKKKATKKQAGYISAQPAIRCNSCTFYHKSGHCEVVQGKVEAYGCCNLWTGNNQQLKLNYASGSDIEDILN